MVPVLGEEKERGVHKVKDQHKGYQVSPCGQNWTLSLFSSQFVLAGGRVQAPLPHTLTLLPKWYIIFIT